jgi:antitoxin (DNA-binding transcriptional repressor) of toxin-antitoxin stability system
MVQVTLSNFKNHSASILALADKGEEIVIRRRGKGSYTLSPYRDDDSSISPELAARIERANQQYKEGKVKFFHSKEELHNYLDSL